MGRIRADEELSPRLAEYLARLAQALRAHREQHGLRQSDMAARCGIDTRTYQSLEAGVMNARLSTLAAICAALDMDICDLFKPCDEPGSPRALRRRVAP